MFFILDGTYFVIIIGLSILEFLNELRNGQIRNRIFEIYQRIRHLREQQLLSPLVETTQQRLQPLRCSGRTRKPVFRLNL